MNENKKRWVAVYFPNGPFQGSVNLAINGNSVMTADAAKELIDATEGQEPKVVKASDEVNNDTDKLCSSGCSCCKGKTTV